MNTATQDFHLYKSRQKERRVCIKKKNVSDLIHSLQ